MLAIAALIEDDIAAAMAEASSSHVPGDLFGPLVHAVCCGEMNLLDEAARQLRAVCDLVPGFLEDPAAVIGAAPTIPAHVIGHLVTRVDATVRRLGGDAWRSELG